MANPLQGFVTPAQFVLAQADYPTNVKSFGVIGDGINDDTTAFLSALGAYPVIPATLTITGPVKLTSNITIPSNISIRIVKGGSFIVSTGKVLEIRGGFSVQEELQQVFSITSSVVGLRYAIPQWWGAKGDGITDDTKAFQKAVYAVSAHALCYPDAIIPIDLYRSNETLMVLNTVRRWKMISSDDYKSIWKCTTAGTTATIPPDITGIPVGGTVTDGTVVWTKLSNGVIPAGKVYVPASSQPYMIQSGFPSIPTKGNYSGGIMMMTGSLVFEMNPNTVLQAIPLTGTANGNILNIRNNAHVLVKGGTLVGDSASHLSGDCCGIAVVSCRNVVIRDVKVREVAGDGIKIGSEWDSHTSAPSTDILIDNIVSDKCYRNGMSIFVSKNVKVINSTFSNTKGTLPEAGIDIEPDYGDNTTTSGIIIEGNHFINNATFDVVFGGGKACSNIFILNNLTEGSVTHSIFETGNASIHAKNVIIAGNIINILSGCNEGISAAYGDDFVISGNLISGSGVNGILIANGIDTLVVGNTVKGPGSGISVSGSDIKVASNIISGCYSGINAQASTSTDISIEGNDIHDVSLGIVASYTGGTISNNAIKNTQLTALTGSPVDIAVTGNRFKNFGTNVPATYAGILQTPQNCVYSDNCFYSTTATQKAIYLPDVPTSPSIVKNNVARYGASTVFNLNAGHIIGTNYTL